MHAVTKANPTPIARLDRRGARARATSWSSSLVCPSAARRGVSGSRTSTGIPRCTSTWSPAAPRGRTRARRRRRCRACRRERRRRPRPRRAQRSSRGTSDAPTSTRPALEHDVARARRSVTSSASTASTTAPSASVPRERVLEMLAEVIRREVRERAEPHRHARHACRALGLCGRLDPARRDLSSARARAPHLLLELVGRRARPRRRDPRTSSPSPADEVALLRCRRRRRVRATVRARGRARRRLRPRRRVSTSGRRVPGSALAARVEPVHGSRRRTRGDTRRRRARRLRRCQASSSRVGSCSQSSTVTSSGSAAAKSFGDGQARRVVAAVRVARRRSRRSAAHRARPRGRGSASRTRCTGRSCGSSARRARAARRRPGRRSVPTTSRRSSSIASWFCEVGGTIFASRIVPSSSSS